MFFDKNVKKVGEEGEQSKKLMPYSPNAPRNRPKETVRHAIWDHCIGGLRADGLLGMLCASTQALASVCLT